jgi:hypothetical protein
VSRRGEVKEATPWTDEQDFQLVGGKRFRDVATLSEVAAEFREPSELVGGLHNTLGDDTSNIVP